MPRNTPTTTDLPRVCQTCWVSPAVKQIKVMNGRSTRWRCLSCYKRLSTSFIVSHKAAVEATRKRKRNP